MTLALCGVMSNQTIFLTEENDNAIVIDLEGGTTVDRELADTVEGGLQSLERPERFILNSE